MTCNFGTRVHPFGRRGQRTVPSPIADQWRRSPVRMPDRAICSRRLGRVDASAAESGPAIRAPENADTPPTVAIERPASRPADSAAQSPNRKIRPRERPSRSTHRPDSPPNRSNAPKSAFAVSHATGCARQWTGIHEHRAADRRHRSRYMDHLIARRRPLTERRSCLSAALEWTSPAPGWRVRRPASAGVDPERVPRRRDERAGEFR